MVNRPKLNNSEDVVRGFDFSQRFLKLTKSNKVLKVIPKIQPANFQYITEL